MQPTTRSILEELQNHVPVQNCQELLDNRAHHIITSACRLLDQVHACFDANAAQELEKRFMSSIKNRDARRFSRSIRSTTPAVQHTS